MSKTVIALLLDKSGSMHKNALETISGYNDEVRSIKNAPVKEGDEVFVCLYTFDYHVTEHLWMQPASELQESNDESYKPAGGTAYYDAIAYVSTKIAGAVDKDTDVLIKIISDGEDYNSQYYSADETKAIMAENESTEHWTYTFLGCKNLKEIASKLGVKTSNLAMWDNSVAKSAMEASAGSTENYLRRKSLGVSGQSLQSNFYSNAETVADYCSAPSNATLRQTQPDQFDLSKNTYDAFKGGNKIVIEKANLSQDTSVANADLSSLNNFSSVQKAFVARK
jgi:uncharacterized protein YegL